MSKNEKNTLIAGIIFLVCVIILVIIFLGIIFISDSSEKESSNISAADTSLVSERFIVDEFTNDYGEVMQKTVYDTRDGLIYIYTFDYDHSSGYGLKSTNEKVIILDKYGNIIKD